MNQIGYDAMTLGEIELERGDAYVRDLIGRLKAKVVVSNVQPVGGKAPWLESAIIKKGDKRIAILGLMTEEFGRGAERISDAGWTVEDPTAALNRLLPALRKRADMVVVLGHVNQNTATTMEKEAKGIDLLIPGHMPGLPSEHLVAAADSAGARPAATGPAVLKSGQRGEYLGRIALDSSKKGAKFGKPEAIMIELAKISEDVKIAKDLADLKAEIDNDTRKAQLQRELESTEGLVLGQDRFLGEATCNRCHAPVQADLAQGPHAHAFATLEKAGRAQDQSCLPCHVTGFGAPGGFGTADISTEVDMKNVQCESCHGMGTQHDWTRTASGSAAEEATCLKCHVPEWSPRWDYHAYMKKLGHGASKL
jgi:2',3'-cyclic-nucleotide 2'-phosphodiesterase (5'-nucleotidase family)